MNEERKLLDALTARAAEDARAFRKSKPRETPTERWIENSYTAALPLAEKTAGVDLGPGPHPHLFDVYRREIAQQIGERPASGEAGSDLQEQPTPGEN